MEDKRKIIGTLLGILGFIAAMAGLTYAMYVTDITNTNVITGGRSDACENTIDIVYNKGTDINESEVPLVNSYTETSTSTTITFHQNPNLDCGKSIGQIHIHTNSSTSNNLINTLKYTIEKIEGTTSTVTETYTGYITKKGSSCGEADTTIDIGLLEEATTTYKVYLWIDANESANIAETVAEAAYTGYIHATANQESTFK